MSVAKPIPVGSRLIDSLPFSQSDGRQAAALKADDVDGVALYLGVASAACVTACLAAGLGVVGVTLAAHYDGAAAVAAAKASGMAPGTTLLLDVEGMPAYNTPPDQLIAKINAWADAVAAAGYMPGIYLGSPQPLTSDELTHLRVVRYWRAPARVVDRFGKLAEPASGWCMFQAWPSLMWRKSGVFVDVDFVYEDFRGRVPSWTIAA